MKKLDGVDRIIKRELLRAGGNGIECEWLDIRDVAKLLRREHAWMKRMVQQTGRRGMMVSRYDLLKKIAQRRT